VAFCVTGDLFWRNAAKSLSLQFEPTIAAVSTTLIGLTVTILVFNALLQRTKQRWSRRIRGPQKPSV
jgi:ABC-type spermidine/putrescine transport system permease subunit II